MPFGIPDTRQFPWDDPLAKHLGQLNNATYGGINSWLQRPTVGVDGSALGSNHKGYTGVLSSKGALEQWDGSKWTSLIDSAKLVRSGSISFYVNQTTGSDTNDGMSPTTAFKTTSKLYWEMLSYNFQERQIFIYLGPGYYQIFFPYNTSRLAICIIGESSATVKLSTLVVLDQDVVIRKLTVSYPGLTGYYSLVNILGGGRIQIGDDIVLGDSGPNPVFFYLRDSSQLAFYPTAPITITHNAQHIFGLYNSWATFIGYSAPGTGAAPADPLAPQVVRESDVYTSTIPPLVPGNDTTNINFVGNRSVLSVMWFSNGAKIEGNTANSKLNITGNVTGIAYQVSNNSYLNCSTYTGAAAGYGIGFSSTLSAGQVDGTSYVNGTKGI